jgi:hypothetical protein
VVRHNCMALCGLTPSFDLLRCPLQRYINAEAIATLTLHTRAFTAHCCAEAVRFNDAAARIQSEATYVSSALQTAADSCAAAAAAPVTVPPSARELAVLAVPSEGSVVAKEASAALTLLALGAHASSGLRWFDYISW